MTEIVFTLISLIALGVFALFFSCVFKLPSSTTPLVALGFSVLYFILFGVFGVLIVGGYLYFISALIIAVLFALKKLPMTKPSFWFVAFFAVSAVMTVFFGLREPPLNSWDEFSFWGTAVKLTRLGHELPATADFGWPWVASQKVGLVTIGYLFNFIGEYQPWRIFVGLNVLALSVVTALLTHIKANLKASLGVICALILFFTPYVFTVIRQPISPSDVYMNALSDLPMAWLFAGVIVLYYTLDIGTARLWPVAIILTALTMTRDTALPFALIAWVIITFDMFLVTKNVRFLSFGGVKAKTFHSLCMLFCVLTSFFGWTLYIGSVTSADPLGNIGGSDELGMVEMMTLGVFGLFGINATESFSSTMSDMTQAFFTLPISMMGAGVNIVLFILFILAVAAVFTGERAHRLRCVIFAILSSLGFVAYHTFIGFTFAFVFKDDVSRYLIGYERYIYPYYLAWFVVALFLLLLSCRKPKMRFVPQGLLLVILCLFALLFYRYIPNGMTFLDCHDGYLDERYETVATAEEVITTLGEGEQGDIYFISQGDNGERWFQFSHDLLPLHLYYSFGGGTLTLPGGGGDYEMTPDEFYHHVTDSGCEYVFVEQGDDALMRDFSPLFDDELSSISQGGGALYAVREQDNGVGFYLLSEVGG